MGFQNSWLDGDHNVLYMSWDATYECQSMIKVIYIHKKTTQVTKIILTQYGGLIKPFPNSLTNCKLFIFTKKSLILQ